MITNTKIRRGVAVLLCAGVLFLAVCFILAPKKEFSENENRYLAAFPALSFKAVADGGYTKELGDWVADHFPWRDFFVGLKSGAEIISGRRCINGIYVAKDDYLIESYSKPQSTERIIETLADFYAKIDTDKIDVRLMLVPTAVTVYEDKLPKYAPSYSQIETAEAIYGAAGIPEIDCTGQLMDGASKGQLYYRTDHHWTTWGAYCGYLAYCEAAGIEPVPLEGFEERTVTEEFAGTLYSKLNDYSHKKDSITLYTDTEAELTVTYADTGEKSDSLYNLDYLSEKDKYSLFLNNIHPLIEIENAAAKSDGELIIIKDSYANSMVPFLVRHYRKIYVFDTRYYRGGPSAFLKEHGGVTDILLMYNLNTIDSDTGIRGIY